MVSANYPPPKPAGTHFVIQRTDSFLSVRPQPELLNFEQRLRRLALPFKTRLLVTVIVVLMTLLIQVLIFSYLPWVLIIMLGVYSPILLIWLFTSARSIHLYFYGRQNQFKICQCSLESGDRPDKILLNGLISEIQYVVASQHSHGRWGATQGITIHTSQPHPIDWQLTQAESMWIVHEIQSWLASQRT